MQKNRRKIRVALLQFAAEDGKVKENYKTLSRLLKTLKGPVDLVVLPEMWPSGFRVKEGKTLLRETKVVLEDLKKWVRTHRCFLVGSHLEKGKGGFYNTASVINPQGKIVGRYHKVHLFQMGNEHKKFLPGPSMQVVKTPLGVLGLSICYDIRFPELIRKEVLAGAEILVIPSGWPLVRIDHYLTLLKARAIENLCYVVSANKIGKNAQGIVYGGHSVAFDPWGKKLEELGEKEGVLKVTLDLQQLHKIRSSFPVFEARREEVYSMR